MNISHEWICLVCGYRAVGTSPPAECPACGAAESQFAPLRPDGGAAFLSRYVRDLYDTFMLHPVSVHFSNALIPVSLLLLLLAMATAPSPLSARLEGASFYTLIISALSLPVSYLSGLRDWKTRYRKLRLPVFRKKAMLAKVIIVLTAGAAALRAAVGAEAVLEPTAAGAAYLLLLAASTFTAVLLGHMGAKLVFHWKKELGGEKDKAES